MQAWKAGQGPVCPLKGRGAILQALTGKTPLAVEMDMAAVGASPESQGFSGSDLAAQIWHYAAVLAFCAEPLKTGYTSSAHALILVRCQAKLPHL